jgi:hypothetical protein
MIENLKAVLIGIGLSLLILYALYLGAALFLDFTRS